MDQATSMIFLCMSLCMIIIFIVLVDYLISNWGNIVDYFYGTPIDDIIENHNKERKKMFGNGTTAPLPCADGLMVDERRKPPQAEFFGNLGKGLVIKTGEYEEDYLNDFELIYWKKQKRAKMDKWASSTRKITKNPSKR